MSQRVDRNSGHVFKVMFPKVNEAPVYPCNQKTRPRDERIKDALCSTDSEDYCLGIPHEPLYDSMWKWCPKKEILLPAPTTLNVHRIKMCITTVSRPVGWPARSWFIGDHAPVFLE